jgi:hypothetical protein
MTDVYQKDKVYEGPKLNAYPHEELGVPVSVAVSAPEIRYNSLLTDLVCFLNSMACPIERPRQGPAEVLASDGATCS